MNPARSSYRILPLLAAAVLAGCDQNTYYFYPAKEGPEPTTVNLPTTGEYTLAADGDAEATLTLWARGVRNEDRSYEGAQAAQDIIVLNGLLQSDLDRPVTLDVIDSYLVDDEGNRVNPTIVRGTQASAGNLTVDQHQKSQYELVFDLPGPEPLNRLGSFRYKWRARVGDDAARGGEAKFIKAETIQVYDPPIGYPGRGYYPAYGPYPYGPHHRHYPR